MTGRSSRRCSAPFRFADQRAGDAYLAAAHPAFHLTTRHGKDEPLVAFYKNRTHGESVSEGELAADFEAHGAALLANVGRAFHRDLSAAPPPIAFTPLRHPRPRVPREGDECLGDCPDAAYYGPHVLPDSDRVEMLSLGSDDTLHLVSLVDHQQLGAATYRLRRTARAGAGARRRALEDSNVDPRHLDRRHELRPAGRAGASVLDVGVHAEPVALRAARRRRRRLHAGDRRRGAARLVPHLLRAHLPQPRHRHRPGLGRSAAGAPPPHRPRRRAASTRSAISTSRRFPPGCRRRCRSPSSTAPRVCGSSTSSRRAASRSRSIWLRRRCRASTFRRVAAPRGTRGATRRAGRRRRRASPPPPACRPPSAGSTANAAPPTCECLRAEASTARCSARRARTPLALLARPRGAPHVDAARRVGRAAAAG